MCSITLESTPRFELVIPDVYPEPVYPEYIKPIGLRYKANLTNLTKLDELSQQTIEAYYFLQYLTDEKVNQCCTRMTITIQEFRTRNNQLMRQLTKIAQYKIPESSKPYGLIFELFANTALIHSIAYNSKSSRVGSVIELLVKRIRATLEVINISSFQIAFPEMILWIIISGGVSSIRTQHEAFFVRVLAEACLAAGINDYTSEIGIFLGGFMWNALYMNAAAIPFWDKVAAAKLQAKKADTSWV